MSNQDPARLRAAERALEAAIRDMGQPLIDASTAAHEMDALDPPQDERDADHDRLLWLGAITEGAANLCTPKLRILAAIVDELVEVEEPGEIGDKRHRAN
jgi:hypothetical protein